MTNYNTDSGPDLNTKLISISNQPEINRYVEDCLASKLDLCTAKNVEHCKNIIYSNEFIPHAILLYGAVRDENSSNPELEVELEKRKKEIETLQNIGLRVPIIFLSDELDSSGRLQAETLEKASEYLTRQFLTPELFRQYVQKQVILNLELVRVQRACYHLRTRPYEMRHAFDQKFQPVLLVVDDSPRFIADMKRQLAGIVFQGKQIDIQYAATRTEVMRKMETDPTPNLLLMDIDLGEEIEGTDIIDELLDRGENLQYVYMTNSRDPSAIVEELHGQALDYIRKPIKFNILKARIDNYYRWIFDHEMYQNELNTQRNTS